MNLTLKRSLFHPFEFISDFKALFIGLTAILLTAVAGYFSSVHLDGPIDMHSGPQVPIYFFIMEGLIDWLVLALLLYVFGLLVSKSHIRFIDIIGMQSMARWPMLIAVLSTFIAPIDKFNRYIEYAFMQKGEAVSLTAIDILLIGTHILLVLLCIVWMIALMYKAYSISCNIKGAKAIVTFIIALLISEVVIKIFLSYMLDISVLPEV